jgi:predicted nucleic acid-binding protein
MKVIVDSNIVFSAILNSQGKFGNLLINGSRYFEFYTVSLLKAEILEHKEKIIKVSELTESQFEKAYQVITKRIIFVDEILLSDSDILKAIELVSGVDEDDALFVALKNHLKSKLWTGDKKLINGLKNKGFNRIITTEELYELFLDKRLQDSLKKRNR